MGNTKVNVISKSINWCLSVDAFKNYKEDTDKWFLLHFLYKSIIISFSLFLSFITPVLNILPVLVCSIAILTERTFNRLYYLILITPFWFVFDWILVVYGVIFLSWGLKYVRDLCNKQVKFNLKALIIALIPIIYVSLPIGVTRLDYIAFMATFSFILYFVFTYREYFSFKRFAITSATAILASALLGFIALIFKDLYDFDVVIKITDKLFRFSACNKDCNFLGAYLVAIFASLTYLYLRKDINILYLCLIPVFTILVIITGSKLTLLMYICVVLYLLFSIIFSKDNIKNKITKLATIILMISLCSLILKDFVAMIFGRFSVDNVSFSVGEIDPVNPDKDNTVVQPPSGNIEQTDTVTTNVLSFITTILTSKFGLKLSSITSYRFDLWLLYLNNLLLSPLSFIFGRGEGAERLFIRNNLNQLLREPHNSMVDLVYYLGVAFLIFVIFLFIVFIRYRKKQGAKFNRHSIMVIVTSLVVSCSISAFWSYMFVFLILNATLCMFEVKKGEKNENITNK